MTADEILKKHEDENEMHFHEVDRKFIIEAMQEYAALKYINEEQIREEAQKAAYRSQFMSNHIYDQKSYEDGYYAGMSQTKDQG